MCVERVSIRYHIIINVNRQFNRVRSTLDIDVILYTYVKCSEINERYRVFLAATSV